MWMTCVPSPISATPLTRPNAAVISGIPAASSDPKVSRRITIAASTPTAVAGPMLKPSAFSITAPPAASLRPLTWTPSIAARTVFPVELGSWFWVLS